jgi:hypothetical protein
MATRIFVNLPVKDVMASLRFYESLGYQHNPQFTDETAALCTKAASLTLTVTGGDWCGWTRQRFNSTLRKATRLQRVRPILELALHQDRQQRNQRRIEHATNPSDFKTRRS